MKLEKPRGENYHSTVLQKEQASYNGHLITLRSLLVKDNEITAVGNLLSGSINAFIIFLHEN